MLRPAARWYAVLLLTAVTVSGCTGKTGSEPAIPTPSVSLFTPSLSPSLTPIPIAPTPSPTPILIPTPALSPSTSPNIRVSEDKKPISWYYMKKKKGEVPNFPNELKKLKPEDKVVWVGTGKKVYLTFDTGGPLGDIDKMLKILKDNDVKASYFIAGYNMKAHPDFLKRLVAEGHLVANHTMTHTDMTTQTDEQVKKEIDDFAAMYKSITGQNVPKIFRFPYGTFSYHLVDYVSSLGYTSVFWSTAMKDWVPRENPDDPYRDIMNNLHDGNIILMHEGSEENINALDKIIKGIKQEGYEFGLVSELIK